MKTRMQPIDHIWSKLPRVVRDLASALRQAGPLVMEGKETELDRSLLEAIKDPLTHLVRNAVDHGIEEPGASASPPGKPAEGTLTLRAYHEGGQVTSRSADDGARHRPRAGRAKARRARACVTRRPARQRWTARDILAADLPARLLHRRRGHQRVRPRRRHGRREDQHREDRRHRRASTRRPARARPGASRIPLTLAIIPALTVDCGGERYAMPQVSLLELVCLDGQRRHRDRVRRTARPVYRLRGKLLPLVRLDRGARPASRPATERPATSWCCRPTAGASAWSSTGC